MRPLPKPLRIPPADRVEADRLQDVLDRLRQEPAQVPGLQSDERRDAFLGQLIESQRRTRYIERLKTLDLRSSALDAAGSSFDPLKGALLKLRASEFDEACWLVFLATHFGRSRRTDWQLAGDFYGRLGAPSPWDWSTVNADPLQVRGWLDAHQGALRARGGRFGNHRKYESTNAWEVTGTGQVIATYVEWVGGPSHADRFARAVPASATPRERFAATYESLGQVARFGRAARFDLLMNLAKIGLIDVEADRAYLAGATGPVRGARLLLDGSPASSSGSRDLEMRLKPLQEELQVTFDVLEDAMCNWQKSPDRFVPFRG